MTRILTAENESYDLDFVPEEIEDITYCVLDYSDLGDVDYKFMPLVFLESFISPTAVLKIGNIIINIPLDWSIIVSEPSVSDPEILPITSLNNRGFKAFIFNPITGYLPRYKEIEIINIYQEMKWFIPKLAVGHILAVPIEDKANPNCIFFVKETNKLPDTLDTGDLW